MAQSKTAVIRSDLDIVIARTMTRDAAKALGFGAIDQARIATAVSELARNIFLYAGTGNVTVREVEKPGRKIRRRVSSSLNTSSAAISPASTA